MSSVNRISTDYMFFRFPLNYLLVLIPIIVSVAGNVFFNFSFEILEQDEYSPNEQVYDSLDRFLLSMKVSISVLLAFSVCYRWSSMQYDGSYGYWLTQGMGRKQFYLLAIMKFFGAFLLSEIIGFWIVIYLNGYFFEIGDLIMIVLLMASQLFLILVLAVLMGVVFKTSELASLSFLALVGVNTAFNTDRSSNYSLIFQPDAHYLDDGVISFVLSLTVGIVIFLSGLRIHTRLDLRL